MADISINQSFYTRRVGANGRNPAIMTAKATEGINTVVHPLWTHSDCKNNRLGSQRLLDGRIERNPPDLVLGRTLTFAPCLSHTRQRQNAIQYTCHQSQGGKGSPHRHPTDTSNFMQPPSASKRPFTVSVVPPPPPPPPPVSSRPTSTTTGSDRNLTICFS